jgi:uncharacterized protein YdiU (UPF0061 family)
MTYTDPTALHSDRFVSAFSGNDLLRGLDRPYCTAYTVSINGDLVFPSGSKGDGRAAAVGEIFHEGRFELQLKGSGRSPFSRGADGRAVLRSCIRGKLSFIVVFNVLARSNAQFQNFWHPKPCTTWVLIPQERYVSLARERM